MILQEKIQNVAKRFGKLAPVFLEGAEFALNNQWISVKDDLPCYHKELIDPRESLLQTVLVIVWDGFSAKMDYMYYENKEWKWCHNKLVIYWMLIPESPKKIGGKTMIREDIRGYCNRDCIYSDNGRCDMWDDFAMPEDVNECDNYTENI